MPRASSLTSKEQADRLAVQALWLGLGYAELAHAFGYSYEHVRAILNGRSRSPPGIEEEMLAMTLEKAAEVRVDLARLEGRRTVSGRTKERDIYR